MIKRLIAACKPKQEEAPQGSEKYGHPAEYIVLNDYNYIAYIRMCPGILLIVGIEVENKDTLVQLWDMTLEVIQQLKIQVVRYVCECKPEFIEQLLVHGFIERPYAYETTWHHIYEYRPEVVD